MNVIILGPPGVGKGTYSTFLSNKHAITRISVGDLLREAIQAETKLGKQIRPYVSRGDLVPDKIVIELVKMRLQRDDCTQGFLLDGFPRTTIQAETLEENVKLDKVLNFVASEKVLLARLGGRMTCRKCGAIYHVKEIPPRIEGLCDLCGDKLYRRQDEAPRTIQRRLRLYHERTKPVIDYFRNKGLLVDIDANYPFEKANEVFSQCEVHLEERR